MPTNSHIHKDTSAVWYKTQTKTQMILKRRYLKKHYGWEAQPPLPPLNCTCPKFGRPSQKGLLRPPAYHHKKQEKDGTEETFQQHLGLSETEEKIKWKCQKGRSSIFWKKISFQMKITLTEINIGTRPGETLLEKLNLICFMKWSQQINSWSQATNISIVNDLFSTKTFWWLIRIKWADVSYM